MSCNAPLPHWYEWAGGIRCTRPLGPHSLHAADWDNGVLMWTLGNNANVTWTMRDPFDSAQLYASTLTADGQSRWACMTNPVPPATFHATRTVSPHRVEP